MKSLSTDEIARLLEELNTNEDLVIGLLEVMELSYGDSDNSDEEAEGNIDQISRLEIAREEEDDGEHTGEEPMWKKKRVRKWMQKDRQAPDAVKCTQISPSEEASSSVTSQQCTI